MITKVKISELTYEQASEFLGKEEFCMHYDASDCLRSVRNQGALDDVKDSIIRKYGDVYIILNNDPGVFWSDRVTIDSDCWKANHNEYNDIKNEWCNKYGCD